MKMLSASRTFTASAVACALLFSAQPVAAIDGTEPLTTVDSGSGAEALSNPSGLAVDAAGNIYVSDSNNHRVQRIAADGVITTVAGGNGSGSAMNQLVSPRALAVDSSGNLYIADTGNHRIQKVANNGTVTTVAGGGGQGSGSDQLREPQGVALASDGTLYIADTTNSRIQKVETDGAVTTVGATVDTPRGLTVDDSGNLYIADTGNHRVLRVTPDGSVTTVAGGNGSGDGSDQLASPWSVAIDDDDSLYVADKSNNRIQKATAEGVTTSVATFPDTGLPSSPTVERLALDSEGSLYYVLEDEVKKLTAFDLTNPTASITSPSADAEIPYGSSASIEFSCADTGTSGLATCTATLDGTPITSGTAIDTNAAGERTLSVTATDQAGNAGVETIVFTVQTAPIPEPLQLAGPYADSSGIEGSTARLYVAVFSRQPDAGGHAYWVERASGELSLRDVARFFIASPEFVETYSELDDAAFIDLLYINVMGREGDAGGVRFWNEQLSSGMDRSEVVLQFSESPEFKVLTGSN